MSFHDSMCARMALAAAFILSIGSHARSAVGQCDPTILGSVDTPGFAHGNLFTEATTVEYFCSGEYSPGCEAGISPLADDIDWSLSEPELARIVGDRLSSQARLMTDKDRDGFSLAAWGEQPGAREFVYGIC